MAYSELFAVFIRFDLHVDFTRFVHQCRRVHCHRGGAYFVQQLTGEILHFFGDTCVEQQRFFGRRLLQERHGHAYTIAAWVSQVHSPGSIRSASRDRSIAMLEQQGEVRIAENVWHYLRLV